LNEWADAVAKTGYSRLCEPSREALALNELERVEWSHRDGALIVS
jgi:hypothetical protein